MIHAPTKAAATASSIKIFGEFTDMIINIPISLSKEAERDYIVFDVYQNSSKAGGRLRSPPPQNPFNLTISRSLTALPKDMNVF